MAGSSNTLRAVLTELGWSRTRLVAELRRQAARSGESLPGTESLIAMVSSQEDRSWPSACWASST